jgi:predicted Zn-dependent protease with MMP-like domain
VKLPHERFEALVAEALDGLPESFMRHMQNVEVIVEAWPAARTLRDAGVPRGETLFGLYEGIPLTERTTSYGNVLPDRITIFQGPIESACASEDEVRAEVQDTVVHEFAHFFGIGDDELRQWGVY